MGIPGHADTWKAIFKHDKGDGKSRVMVGSERVNDWTIASIDPAGVNLTQGKNKTDFADLFKIRIVSFSRKGSRQNGSWHEYRCD
ncbi:hypothetical protein A0U92_07190 [Acetobacter aceti]|uniref:Uncharacterized protein n=1 Tax=Acetobacter aceti TaxID=435 RepID=A0A1U9KFS1_ACEAC|nr:hypothetical protein A0U92_07190 [Acetobacter aceti]